MTIGCGYEPAFEGATPWQPPMPPFVRLGYKHEAPKICAAYTTRLPEVQEVARAHMHWEKGALQLFCGGEIPGETLLALIEILDSEVGRAERCAMTARVDGGSRE